MMLIAKTVLKKIKQFLRGFLIMLSLKAAGIGASILVILALVITLLKQIIAFIGIITTIFKFGVILIFAVVFIAVALMVFRTFKDSRKSKE